MSKQKLRSLVFEYAMIAFGALLMSIGIGVFLIDAHVVPGGVSGLSMAIYYLTDGAIPVGAMMWFFNIPLFWWGTKQIGSQFGWRTFFGFTLNSIFIDLVRGEFPLFATYPLHKLDTIQYLLQQDFLFLILWGAVLLGTGLGIIFKFKGTTAGSDIVAAVMNKKWGIKPGQAIIVIDFFVIVFAGLVIANKGLDATQPVLSLTMYAFFLLFISSKLIDVIIDGIDYARSVLIISDKKDAIGQAIMSKLSRGATEIRGKGLYLGQDRDILYTVVTRREVAMLYDIINSIDDKAFVIVGNVHEVMGDGFKRRNAVGLPKF
jgi:uncharacterized membrane-anchored protein YitT (DUF2179 family)